MSPVDPRPVPTTCSSCGEPLVEGKTVLRGVRGGRARRRTAAGARPSGDGRTTDRRSTRASSSRAPGGGLRQVRRRGRRRRVLHDVRAPGARAGDESSTGRRWPTPPTGAGGTTATRTRRPRGDGRGLAGDRRVRRRLDQPAPGVPGGGRRRRGAPRRTSVRRRRRPRGGGVRRPRAASAVPNDTDPHWTLDGSHAACTIVVAVATPSELHMVNVGDARGYAGPARRGGVVGRAAHGRRQRRGPRRGPGHRRRRGAQPAGRPRHHGLAGGRRPRRRGPRFLRRDGCRRPGARVQRRVVELRAHRPGARGAGDPCAAAARGDAWRRCASTWSTGPTSRWRRQHLRAAPPCRRRRPISDESETKPSIPGHQEDV